MLKVLCWFCRSFALVRSYVIKTSFSDHSDLSEGNSIKIIIKMKNVEKAWMYRVCDEALVNCLALYFMTLNFILL